MMTMTTMTTMMTLDPYGDNNDNNKFYNNLLFIICINNVLFNSKMIHKFIIN